MHKLMVAAAFILVVVASCSGNDDKDPGADDGDTTAEPSDGVDNDNEAERDDTGLIVSSELADELGWEWPLTVDHGHLRCEDEAVVFIDPDGNEWGVNGMAVTLGWDEIDPIWADNPEVDDLKINISPLIALGLQECEES